ncbi:hypothetical protein ACQU0X_26610 [Pseudovibrio ascidiaceicola]|uniref:hypothetical protein n=1 Tax=Pseudovibrio ascidiaceicola TaxID=285279 RepID=UPI003D36AFDF
MVHFTIEPDAHVLSEISIAPIDDSQLASVLATSAFLQTFLDKNYEREALCVLEQMLSRNNGYCNFYCKSSFEDLTQLVGVLNSVECDYTVLFRETKDQGASTALPKKVRKCGVMASRGGTSIHHTEASISELEAWRDTFVQSAPTVKDTEGRSHLKFSLDESILPSLLTAPPSTFTRTIEADKRKVHLTYTSSRHDREFFIATSQLEQKVQIVELLEGVLGEGQAEELMEYCHDEPSEVLNLVPDHFGKTLTSTKLIHMAESRVAFLDRHYRKSRCLVESFYNHDVPHHENKTLSIFACAIDSFSCQDGMPSMELELAFHLDYIR